MEKILLHACCAPCSIKCVETLRKEGFEPSLLWYNPNIHPYTEFKSRREALGFFCGKENIELLETGEYGLRLFLDGYAKSKSLPRCEFCYDLRLETAARFAAEQGFCAFTTSLLISPYQNHALIAEIARQKAAKYGIEFVYRDFRPLFREGQAAARAMGLYMQKYCGCIFSEEERYLGKKEKTSEGNRT